MKKAFSKSLSWLLSVVMIFGLFAFVPASSLTVQALVGNKSGFSTNYTIGGDAGQNVANVAYAQIGKKAENLGYYADWCAMFAHDCAELAGQGSAVPNQPWVPSLPKDLKDAGAKEVSAQEARPGDILLIDANYSGEPEHVEIVYKVENGNVYSIGGNTGTYDHTTSSVCSPRVHPSHVYAIYRPNYGGTPKPTATYVAVSEGTHYTPTAIWWDQSTSVDHYDLKIWKGTCWQGDAYAILWNLKDTSATLNLPEGHYEAYVDSVNGEQCTMSTNIVKFDIGAGQKVDRGTNFYGLIIRYENWAHVADEDGNAKVNNEGNIVWYFTKTSDGGYKIKNVATNKYLDVYGAYDEDNNNVQTWETNDSDAQIWYIYGRWSGEYVFKPKCTSNKVLDVNPDTNNAITWTYNPDNANQRFVLWDDIKTYTISYNMNGGSGLIENQTKVQYSPLTLSGTKPTRTDYRFVGWNTDKNATTAQYQPNGKYTDDSSATLYAIWTINHNYTTKVIAPTCTEKGYTLHTCTNCGNNYKDTYTNATGHSYTLTSQKSATCTTDGEKVYKCSKCGDTKTETVKATGHNYTTKVVAPTCTEKGYTLHTCTNCGNNYKDTYTNATGHKYELTSQKSATCTTDGEKVYKCSKCGDTKTETVKATGHSYTTKVVAPTCTAKGYTLHTCKNCNESYKDTYTNALGHDYKLTSEKAATCTTDGEKIYTCSRCGDTKTETVKATGHNYTTKVIAPTCTAKGYTLHTCSKCGDSYKDTYTNATGHKYEETIVAPTTTEQGYTLHTCSVCKHSYKDNYTNILLSNNSTLSAETIKLGETIIANAKATGGTGEYLYQVVYKQTTQSKWTTAQSYKANATVTFKPANAVTYDVCVKVKDSNNTEVKKFFTVKVTSDELKNVSTISAQTINLGSTVTVNAKATGSTGFYTYAVYYKQKAQTKWTTKQDFKANNTIAVKPAKATTYDICVKVKDDKGTIVKKYFTVNVTDFTNTSTLSATEIKLGNTVKVSCSATGSTGYYQYAVYYKKTSDTTWTTKQSYSSNNTVTIKPATDTTYDVCVKVKDNKNNEVKKYFTVTVK